jgi:hypothetical protein
MHGGQHPEQLPAQLIRPFSTTPWFLIGEMLS